MSYNFKETMNKPERLAPGHRMCAGCGGTIAVRNVLRGLHEGTKAVIGNATGCLKFLHLHIHTQHREDSYITQCDLENDEGQHSAVLKALNKALKRKGKLQDTNVGLLLPDVNLNIGASVNRFGEYTMDGVGNSEQTCLLCQRISIYRTLTGISA